ncbi:MAG: alpha-rhamnosidase, partial [Clostridia bacterium]|nr:alpha-rhamnosidase [Clostridia bacterium]
YELDVLCSCGELEYAKEHMRSYWGGMLKLGATSIWEQYIPTEQGAEHYAMYGMKYGRSLCHAWGAGPVYLLGRYFLGVKVTSPGAGTFEVKPQPGGFEKIMGTVPLQGGYVYVEYEKGKLKVYTDKEGGSLVLGNKKLALKKDETLTVLVEL